MENRISDTTEEIEPELASRVFRPEKDFLTGGIINLIFFSFVFFGFGFFMWLSAPVDRRVYSIPFSACCWLPMAAFSFWYMLVWKYVSVTLQNGNITMKGVFFNREINLCDIDVVHWGLHSHGQIKVQTALERGTINFYYYTKAERLWLIQYFRNHFPEDQQQNWPLFCLKIALPLLKPKLDKPREAEPDDVLHTRRNWDRLTIIMTSITTLIGIFTAWGLQKPGYLFLPLLPLCMWGFRYTVPKEGIFVRSTSADKELIYLLWWTGAATMILFLLILLDPPREYRGFIAPTGMLIWITPFFCFLIKSEREEKKKALVEAEQAVTEWDDEFKPD